MKHLSRLLLMMAWLNALAAFSQDFLPTTAESLGLSRLKADQTIYNTNTLANLDNWEPYISVLGNSIFLIEANTFAEDPVDPAKQRFGVTFQPAGGGPHREGDSFYGDEGLPFRGAINASRQNGNPGRVAGNKRPGSGNFITGGEASPHLVAEFRLDGRWDLGLDRGVDGRYCTVQTFTLDPATLAQTPASFAFDAVNGRYTSGTVGGQIGRFGGDMAFLDDGNIVVVADDRSSLTAPGTTATAVIVHSDGSIVKDTFVIGAGELWSNVAAYQGGFCVRLSGVLKFYDNEGNFLGEDDTAEANLKDDMGTVTFSFDRGRGDGTRIASHINSPYVFLAGRNNEASQHVRVAVWDSRNRALVTSTNVSELTPENGGGDAVNFQPTWDRVGVAVDALNRIAVAYEFKNAEILNLQTAVRVLAFDGAGFRYLSPSFFAFGNSGTATSGAGQAIRTTRPAVAMTTREICIAAKGEINSTNNIVEGPDTLAQTTFYTVFSHPDPQADPTPPDDNFPASVNSAGLRRLKVDQTIYNTNTLANLDNWEPYISVLGDSTFLIEANTFAEDPVDPAKQRFGVTFQPAGGGAHREGEAFYSDEGLPFRGPINASRQNGNPGRVAGDKRPGAVNLITGGEASPHLVAEFRLDDRWDLGLDRGVDGRYCTVQTFSLNPSTLAQTPLSHAFDAVNGRFTSGTVGGQIGRFGGEVACLDNGNFVVVADDRSSLTAPGTTATAVIVEPDGTIVKDTFVIGAGELWSNVAAHQGGFCVRLSGVMKFYDNDGNFLGEDDTAEATLKDDTGAVTFSFDRGRGDGTRIASHINSPYVFLAGRNNEASQHVRVAVWDSRNRALVTSTNVSELTPEKGGGDSRDFQPTWDRVGVAVDALNRIAVAYEFKDGDILNLQTAARVLAFDGAGFRYLTPSFFTFANYGTATSGAGQAIRTTRPAVAMTTREICIAAKGEINSTNNVAEGPDTLAQTTFYTVFSHPAPQADPTSAGAPAIRISSIVQEGASATLRWSGGTPPFTIQRKTQWTDAWNDLDSTAGRSISVPITGVSGFFRIKGQ